MKAKEVGVGKYNMSTWRRLHESIPLTFTVADVFLSPHTQLYSPLSSIFKSFIWSSQEVSLCFISYFSPTLRISEPFFHWTTVAGFDNLQQRVTVSPLFFSWFLSSSLKLAGRAKIRWTVTCLYRTGCCILLGYDGEWKIIRGKDDEWVVVLQSSKIWPSEHKMISNSWADVPFDCSAVHFI